MLKGIDISKWQLKVPEGYDFIICRASYGKSKDSRFIKHIVEAKKKGYKLLGAYHYAKTNQSYIDNANTFLSQVEQFAEIGTNILLALDIEGADLKRTNAVQWCINWLSYVEQKTGIKPVLYVQSSQCLKFKKVADLGYGLWVAHWNVKQPKIVGWKFWALWQYSDSKGKLDLDYFNGTAEQYLKYCEGVKRL